MFRRLNSNWGSRTVLAAALALLFSSGACRAPVPQNEITFRAAPAHVVEGGPAALSWDAPGSAGVWINGKGRRVGDNYVPFEAAGSYTVIPSHDADPPLAPAGRSPVVTVKYVLTAAPKQGGSPASREAEVTVHFYVSPTEALAMLRRSEAAVLDTRAPQLFASGDNIPGAVNIPRAELDRRADELPRDKTIIVTYLGEDEGEREAWAVVWALAERGLRATVLRGGTAAWWEEIENGAKKEGLRRPASTGRERARPKPGDNCNAEDVLLGRCSAAQALNDNR